MSTSPHRPRPTSRAFSIAPAVTLTLALAATVCAQDPNPPPNPPVDREKMWFAPTAEDWQKPVKVTFQRTWGDALAVAQETQRPILVCVNMDGEIASEHYAGVRYRQPDIAKLYEPYVCVMASVYRHTPRDHDEHGHRILCPRFGSVTCGEHIAIEPMLFEKFFDGKRIAPRHIMVELDGAEKYDVYYAWDTDSVFGAIKDGISKREIVPPPIVRGDRPVVERVASRDVQDRIAVETAYAEGDAALKKALLDAANQHPDKAPDDLLRLAVFGLDPSLSKRAREALAKTDSTSSVDLLGEALRVPMESGEREALIGALNRLGEKSPRARTLAVVHTGLGTRSTAVDVDGWSAAMNGGSTYAPPDRNLLEAAADAGAVKSGDAARDAAAQLARAEASLALAVDPKTAEILAADRKSASTSSRLMFEDAQRQALAAEKLGAKGWRVDAAIGLCAWYFGDKKTAYARALTAMPAIPAGESGWNAISTVALFAEAKRQAITGAVMGKEKWPSEWLSDLDAAYSVLSQHPLGTEQHALAHYDFLKWLGAKARASRVLDQALAKFPESWLLHDRLRGRVLDEQGVDALEEEYATRMQAEGAPSNLEWFAGYASIVTAEFERRRGRDDEALAAYDRAIAHYEKGIARNQESRESADHYVAIALAGRARIAYEAKDYEKALDALLASLARKPEAAASQDGLNISPADTARMLRARFAEQERADLSAKLEAALAKLDPVLLELPAYEREVPAEPNPNRPRRRR